jgi:4-amino-4-deoxy-L-arabinose transferase-like glycosyltransferase
MTVAAGLRFAGIGNLSLSHMDEGGYIGSAMTVATGGPYSFPYSQALQSPPLLPWIIGSLVWLTQAQWPILGVLVSAAFGSGGVLLLFLLGRRWGGNQFGLWAASLLAISDFHVAYSRMVLTDAPLTFWFLLSLYCVTRLWEQAEAAGPVSSDDHRDKRKKSKRQPAAEISIRSWLKKVGWAIAVGLTAGAAWNTKYNGWLVLAISLFSAGIWVVYRKLSAPSSKDESRRPFSQDASLIGCLLLASFVATACYAHWYLFVERHFEGGYAAVTDNHRSYFYSPAAWPRHARSLIGSLAALRHHGWIMAIGLVVGLGWRLIQLMKDRLGVFPSTIGPALTLLFVFGLAAMILIQGTDTALFLLGAVGIIPALLSGRWERVLAAVWCGTFLLLAPLYHPYPRLLLPALPACICLTLWLLQDVWPNLLDLKLASQEPLHDAPSQANRSRLLAASALGIACCLSLIWLLGPHPLGLFAPTRGVWNRWTSHQSYRAAGDAVLEHTPPDAVVICQTQLAMISYCQRMPLPVEGESFATLLTGVPAERDCFLLVDYCWIHGKKQQGALEGLRRYAGKLTPVAIIDNDVNIVTLLDQLTPAQVAAKLARPQPAYTLGGQHISLPAPPPLTAELQDVIVLYRINLPLSK